MRIEARNWAQIYAIDAVMRLIKFGAIQSFITPCKCDRCWKRNCVRHEQTLIRSFEVVGNHLQLVGVEVYHVGSTEQTSRTISNCPGIEGKRAIKTARAHDTGSWGTCRGRTCAQLSSGNPGIHRNGGRPKISIRTPRNERQYTACSGMQVEGGSTLS